MDGSRIKYDQRGRVHEVTTPKGLTLRNGYDEGNNLISQKVLQDVPGGFSREQVRPGVWRESTYLIYSPPKTRNVDINVLPNGDTVEDYPNGKKEIMHRDGTRTVLDRI